jgi:hypothetical protein
MLIELYPAFFPHAVGPDEGVQFSSWWGCLLIGIFYSLFVFLEESSEDRTIFSERNKRSPTQILLIHISFLALLFCVLGACAHYAGYLPHWITDRYDMGEGPLSVANVLFFIGGAVLAVYERQVLFLEITESQSE